MLYNKDQSLKEQGVALRRKYKVSRIGLRTRWFDQGVVNALTPGNHPLPVSVTLTPGTTNITVSLSLRPPARQVVLLAAGMDARAWRLPFPLNTHIFELDKPDVVAAKTTMLQELRAQTTPGQPDCVFPLNAASWTLLAADLTDPDWGPLLQAGGFDCTQPCVCTCILTRVCVCVYLHSRHVFVYKKLDVCKLKARYIPPWSFANCSHEKTGVLEGLLMYLDDVQAAALIGQCAALSAPGSLLLAGWNNAVTLVRAQASSNPLTRQWKSGYPADIGAVCWQCVGM